MVICVAGKNDIAVDVLHFLVANYPKESVRALPNGTDNGNDDWQKSLLKAARAIDVGVTTLHDLYDVEDLLFLSLEYDRLLVPTYFRSKKLFNVHFSLLPEYKGAFTSVWPILNGEDHSGVTLHLIDRGIDTGDILFQRRIQISPTETARDLYFKYIKVGTNLVIETLFGLINGDYEPRQQPSIGSSFYSRKSIDFANIRIDLNKTAFEIHNQIRGYSFKEYQLPELFGKSVAMSEILAARSDQRPGTLIAENDEEIIVSSVDYDVRAIKYRG
ncbi:MAG: formyltransferase family protein [Ignavibacteriales bacterium]|nr:formyltransferase family protein [Ignavibacteriales bacterium]